MFTYCKCYLRCMQTKYTVRSTTVQFCVPLLQVLLQVIALCSCCSRMRIYAPLLQVQAIAPLFRWALLSPVLCSLGCSL